MAFARFASEAPEPQPGRRATKRGSAEPGAEHDRLRRSAPRGVRWERAPRVPQPGVGGSYLHPRRPPPLCAAPLRLRRDPSGKRNRNDRRAGRDGGSAQGRVPPPNTHTHSGLCPRCPWGFPFTFLTPPAASTKVLPRNMATGLQPQWLVLTFSALRDRVRSPPGTAAMGQRCGDRGAKRARAEPRAPPHNTNARQRRSPAPSVRPRPST